ncbi:MAG: hypothetical protein U1E65_16260 [Myxococcota bacterium]
MRVWDSALVVVLGLGLGSGATADEQARVARLSVAAPAPIDKPSPTPLVLGWIRVESPIRAEVLVDGRALGSASGAPVLAPLDRLYDLAVGHRYVITLRRAGFVDANYVLDMTEALVGTTVTIPMVPLDAPTLGSEAPLPEAEACPVGDPGFVSFDSRPWSRLYIGETLLGDTPLSRYKLAAGCYEVTAIRENGEKHSFRITVHPNKTTRYRTQW